MQASVHEFDEGSGAGTVILDTGVVVPFGAEVFAASGLRLLRVGQRLSIEQGPGAEAPEPEASEAEAHPHAPEVITRLWIVGIGDRESIL